MRARAVAPALFLVPPLLLTALAYRPILGCYFWADDWTHLQAIVNEPVSEAIFSSWAGHLYVLRNVVFYLSFLVFGPHPAPFFATALATHLANVGLLFALTERPCGRRLACLGATLWGVAPMHEGALGWYAVYGHVLATALVLATLVGVARAAARPGPVSAWLAAGWSVLLLLASTSFGVAIGIAAAFPLVLLVVLRGRLGRGAWLAVVALPVSVAATYVAVSSFRIATAGLDPVERFRSLADYLLDVTNVAAMFPNLFAAGIGGLFAGLVVPIATYPHPVQLAVAALWVAGCMLTLAAAPPAARRWMLATLLLAGAAYGTVAAGRGTLYGTVLTLPGRGGGVARYHYLASTMLAFGACLTLAQAGARVMAERWKTPALAAALAGIAALWLRSAWTIDRHDESRAETMRTLTHFREAFAGTPAGQVVVMDNRDFYSVVVPNMFAGTVAVYTIFYPSDPRPVRFRDPHPEAPRGASPGTRIAKLLVPSKP